MIIGNCVGIGAMKGATSPITIPRLKLVFAHHSCGGFLLADTGYNAGGLASKLAAMDIFVSDICYEWDAPQNTDIGSSTDIGHWYTWFADETVQGNDIARRDNIMNAVYTEYSQDAYNAANFGSYTRVEDPGGENSIVVTKSCYPNSNVLENAVGDPVLNDIAGQPESSGRYTESNVRAVYEAILPYMMAHPEKMFIILTAPASLSSTNATRARSFNNWLVNEWLQSHSWTNKNVYVWDFYNILTDTDNHHWVVNGSVVHHTEADSANIILADYHATGDNHPNATANQKASDEFVACMDIWRSRWITWSASYVIPPSISTSSLPSASLDEEYSQTLQATGETPIAWSILSGSLPAGLSLNSGTGVISGTPTTEESQTFTVQAQNSGGTDTQEFTISVTSAAAAENLALWSQIVEEPGVSTAPAAAWASNNMSINSQGTSIPHDAIGGNTLSEFNIPTWVVSAGQCDMYQDKILNAGTHYFALDIAVNNPSDLSEMEVRAIDVTNYQNVTLTDLDTSSSNSGVPAAVSIISSIGTSTVRKIFSVNVTNDNTTVRIIVGCGVTTGTNAVQVYMGRFQIMEDPSYAYALTTTEPIPA